MAKKNKKSTRTKKNDSHWMQSLRSWLTSERSTHIQRIVLKCVLIVMLVVGIFMGFAGLERYVNRINRQRKPELSVQLKAPPVWAGKHLIRQLCLSTDIQLDDDLQDETLTRTWAKNLAKNPWVKHVKQVRKFYDGHVEIDCDLRQPIASIQKNDHTYFIDPEGVVLPYGDVHCHLVQIDGAGGRLPSAGETVTSKDLVAGLEVLTKILQMDEQLPETDRLWSELAVLNVANYEGRLNPRQSHLTFFTQRAIEIRWGAAVGRSVPYHEADFKYKLATLYRTFKKFGSFDHLLYVDLRDWRKEKADPVRQSG